MSTRSRSASEALLLLLLAAPAAAAAVPPSRGAPRAARWGQDDPLVVQSVFSKVGAGAKKEKFAAENQGWFARLIGLPPSIQAKVDLSEEYLPDDSPASTSP